MHTPVQGMRGDLWKRYAGIILDGLRPEGASPLRPVAPPRKLIESHGEHAVDRGGHQLDVTELLGGDVRDEVVEGPRALLVAEV